MPRLEGDRLQEFFNDAARQPQKLEQAQLLVADILQRGADGRWYIRFEETDPTW